MEVPKKIPALKGKVNPKAEAELYMAFVRVYDYIDNLVKDSLANIERKITAGDLAAQDFNDLIGIFSQPLAGSNISDPLLQSILQSFGPQDPNFVFAGPIPSFRALELVDLPVGASGYDTIEDEGVSLPQRNIINFVGAGVTASDVGGKTEVNIPGGSSAGTSFFDWINL